MIRRWLAHPLLHGLDLDDPRTTEVRRQIIRGNSFLCRIYAEWYASLAAALPAGDGAVVELGSGAGFLQEFIPGLITSEVLNGSAVSAVLEASRLPFASGALRAVVMTDVLHHLPRVRSFFADAARCVRSGGVLTMIEPWASRWSRLIYGRVHHEPFQPQAAAWEFPSSGPLSGANGALPWIVFERDRAQFQREFPQWRIESITRLMPFRYLVSGGVSMRPLMPGWSFGLWRRLEGALSPWMKSWAMFAQIVLRRVE
jgi:SAM-dependent methyltransferase